MGQGTGLGQPFGLKNKPLATNHLMFGQALRCQAPPRVPPAAHQHLLLAVRGLPAVLYRSALASMREVAAVGLLQATSLPFIVAAATIGLQLHAISPANAAALVAAGLFSVIIFPIISLQLLRPPASSPTVVPEQAHVR